MKKKVFTKRLILKKETVSHLNTDEMNDARGGNGTWITITFITTESIRFSCERYYTACMLDACDPPE
jgi:hypothetical protein